MKNLQPVIKWSGSKRSQARAIVSLVSGRYGTYYESFCGGCSVLYYILNNRPELFRRYVCNDINEPLIELYRLIVSDHRRVWKSYTELWHGLNDGKGAGDLDKKKEYFYKVRDEFNRTHSPELFFFIMRTTTNGMPRYNADGDFNNSFHFTRDGITPDGALEVLEEWSRTLNRHNVEFRSGSYDRISPESDDFVYFDPPYYGSTAVYNEKNGWTYAQEKKLAEIADTLDGKGISFAISNNLKYGNQILDELCERYTAIHLGSKYNNSSYHKKDKEASDDEVLVVNYIPDIHSHEKKRVLF